MTLTHRIVKRAVDLVVATGVLVVFSPMIAATALLVRVFLGAPVLFSQTRPGLKGRPFNIYKFRTMADKRGPDGNLLPDVERLTRFGMALRKTSLDELPQMLNVLKGELTLVGPRPLLMEYLEHYDEEQSRRHDVKPGITGWAQVNGRNAISWNQRFALDVWYVDHASISLDFKILLMTLHRVLRSEGVTPEGGNVVERFRGNGRRDG